MLAFRGNKVCRAEVHVHGVHGGVMCALDNFTCVGRVRHILLAIVCSWGVQLSLHR